MPDAVPAITLWQPWASLVALGAKPYEFRAWAAPERLRGRRIAIHAGARPVRIAEVRALCIGLHSDDPAKRSFLNAEIALPYLDKLRFNRLLAPLGVVLCTAILGFPVRADKLPELAGFANDSDRGQHFNFAWPLTDIEPLEPPVEVRGEQGFWTFSP